MALKLVDIANLEKISAPEYVDIANLEEWEWSRPGFVYLLQWNDLHKIGRSINPTRRREEIARDMRSGEVTIRHVISCQNYVAAEAALHRTFAAQRVRGEWYDLSEAHVRYFCTLTAM